eukprot:gene24314-biopygen10428
MPGYLFKDSPGPRRLVSRGGVGASNTGRQPGSKSTVARSARIVSKWRGGWETGVSLKRAGSPVNRRSCRPYIGTISDISACSAHASHEVDFCSKSRRSLATLKKLPIFNAPVRRARVLARHDCAHRPRLRDRATFTSLVIG